MDGAPQTSRPLPCKICGPAFQRRLRHAQHGPAGRVRSWSAQLGGDQGVGEVGEAADALDSGLRCAIAIAAKSMARGVQYLCRARTISPNGERSKGSTGCTSFKAMWVQRRVRSCRDEWQGQHTSATQAVGGRRRGGVWLAQHSLLQHCSHGCMADAASSDGLGLAAGATAPCGSLHERVVGVTGDQGPPHVGVRPSDGAGNAACTHVARV